MDDLKTLIRDVPDFPTPGVVFRDITPLLQHPEGFARVIEQLAAPWRERGVGVVAAIESRGFLFGAPLALALGVGLVPIRKLGKLPSTTVQRAYSLEYGSNHLEMHHDAVRPGQRVLLVDDVLATGGTARASVEMIEELGGEVAGVSFVIELPSLSGREQLAGYEVSSLLRY